MSRAFTLSRRFYYYLVLAALSGIYVAASLLAPLGPNRFNLTPSKTHLLQLTILLPVVAIWWIAAYGAEKFKSYTSPIRNHKDGSALDTIATGLMILACAIILSGLFNVLRPWANQNGWLTAFTIMSNYISVVGPLVAYSFIYSGSSNLCKLIKARSSNHQTLWMIIILALIIGVYLTAILNYDYLSSTPDPSLHSSFYMSTPLVLLTIALPYVIGWGLGIKAVLNINEYRHQVKGVIYRSFLRRLEIGIAAVIGFYIVVQLFIASSTFLARAGLGSILLIIYLLIISYAIGFLTIASAVKRLDRIEKV